MRFILRENYSKADIDRMIKDEFAQPIPGEGCVYNAPDGSFINIYPKLDDHEDLCYWLEEQGVSELDIEEDAEWFTDTFNYVRCRNSRHLCFVALPSIITDLQLRSLLEWLEAKVSSSSLQVIADASWKIYDLDEYMPDDIIRIIKRYYASGKLY